MNRRYWIAVVLVAVLLLALGALPSLLRNGDPYRAHADPASDAAEDVEAVDAANLSERRYPYVTAALADGESGRYWKGPVGLKGSFAHSPFDEVEAIGTQYPEAVDGDAVYVRENGTVYRITVEQEEP
jgi:hypothetical protein